MHKSLIGAGSEGEDSDDPDPTYPPAQLLRSRGRGRGCGASRSGSRRPSCPSASDRPVHARRVASGDPDHDGFVLWTHLAPQPLAEDGLGGMPDLPVPVQWELATDERFRRVVRRGTEIARPASAHSVHVELAGLPAGREYTPTGPATSSCTMTTRPARRSAPSWSPRPSPRAATAPARTPPTTRSSRSTRTFASTTTSARSPPDLRPPGGQRRRSRRARTWASRPCTMRPSAREVAQPRSAEVRHHLDP
jgi:hypothetical protein